MTSTRLGIALLTLAAIAGPAIARDPTPAETASWDKANALLEEWKEKLQPYTMRLDQDTPESKSDYELSPYYTEDNYSFERTTKQCEEAFKALSEFDKQLGPLREALAAVEQTLGANNAAAVEAKCWSEFGKPIGREPGFSRHVSPDHTKWLDVDVNWPFKWYPLAKKCATAPADWSARVARKTVEKLNDEIPRHEQYYSKDWDKYVGIDVENTPVARIERFMPGLKVVLTYRPDDAALKEAETKLQAAIDSWKEKTQVLIDNFKLGDDSPEFHGDGAEIQEAAIKCLMTSYAQQYVHGEVLPGSVRVTSDWYTAEKNIVDYPIQYGIWIRCAVATPEEKDKGLIRAMEIKMYTKKELGVKAEVPFDDFGIDSVYQMKLSNVSSRGGGFIGTLFKLVFGFGCCFLFLGAIGGGAWFAMKQMNAQKSAAAPGAPPAAPPGAPAPPG